MFVGDRRMKLITLGTMCFALFMVMLDSTVGNVALPTIMKKLNANMAELQWIVDAYVLALASLLLTGGTLGDLFGRRKAFIGGLGLFTLSSLGCALAFNTEMLIAARAVQGMGAAAMMPSTLSILTNTFPDPLERAQAIGLWAGVSGMALAVGPVIGGSMVDSLGWQSIFFINVPIGLIAMTVAWRFVPESAQRDGRSLDLPGQALAIVGLAALTYAFIEANTYGWSSARIVGLFAVAVVAMAAFVVVEARSKSPMLRLSFFRNLTFTGANLVGLVTSFGLFGIIFFMPLFWQGVQGYSPTRSGVLALPMTLGIVTAAIVSGRVVGRVGARLPIALGLALTGAGLLFLTTVHADSSYAIQWPWLVCIGIGSGLAMSPMTTAIMSTVPGSCAGMASATSNTMRQTGSVFGIAVLGSVVTSHFTGMLTAKIQAMRLPPFVLERVLAIATQGRRAVPSHVPAGIDTRAISRAIGDSFTSGLHVGLWVSGLLLLLAGVPIALFTIRDTMPGAQPARAPVGAALAAAHAPAAGESRATPVLEALPAED